METALGGDPTGAQTPSLDDARAEPIYLDVGADGADAAFATYHPAALDTTGPAIVICPEFGWWDLASYRTVRQWAYQLSTAGHPVLRLSFPGTGDSAGSPRDPDRLSAWMDSVAAAAGWLRASSSRTGVVALGIGFGGLIAARATAAGAPIDGLVLWATPDRGKDLLRQMRVLGRLDYAEAFAGQPAPPPLEAGELDTGGFLVSAQTASELGAVNLAELRFPTGLPLGALLLGRDGIETSAGLTASLREQQVEVDCDPGHGYGDLIVQPQTTTLSAATADRVSRWLQARSGRSRLEGGAFLASADGRPELRLAVGDRAVTERPIEIEVGEATLSGVLVVPEGEPAPVCAVFLNAGAIRRVGPNRMWVELARSWAARGVTSLRLDLEGIGEAGGGYGMYRESADLHEPQMVTQTRAALDALVTRGCGDRFLLIGMCSGAFWAYNALLDDPRVQSAMLINQRVIVWDAGLAPVRSFKRIGLQSFGNLRHADTRARLGRSLRWLAGEARRQTTSLLRRRQLRPSVSARTSVELQRLRSSGKRVLWLFAAGEALDEELVETGMTAEFASWPGVSVERIPVISHELRPLSVQAQARAILERALDREFVEQPVRAYAGARTASGDADPTGMS